MTKKSPLSFLKKPEEADDIVAAKKQGEEEFKKKLTPEYLQTMMPELYHGARLLWYRSFHKEDLDAPPEEPSFLAGMLPYITGGLIIINILITIMKK